MYAIFFKDVLVFSLKSFKDVLVTSPLYLQTTSDVMTFYYFLKLPNISKNNNFVVFMKYKIRITFYYIQTFENDLNKCNVY